ncbi:uncharacterized protein CYBJADRAFT_60488 [Cyberlindnera jadinii NRRL Y-1542]|uniref:Uncharacterized protein n=2 Tax=Cyberlindnera jadinii (strain ATCC 18201 / CBS 1600 / BCRC 20928 / JCM 3617 / NBRC 0987 / NRRL Y-1542) TaxID=983966 RepID=A0A1E4S5B5_CYBJN|nr:hypothetical protein CYBJADRAFT_60488 [Cyberlindnera jadinii NRRL Y-1542]ODV74698.1 hypothetical protein CYBJADRAFT_60488 [Cyberlindnera jadinii NRRL Y-1542]
MMVKDISVNWLSWTYVRATTLLAQALREMPLWVYQSGKFLVRSIGIGLFSTVWKFIKVIAFLLRAIVTVIFEPISLLIHILEYNAHVFLNFWLSLLFQTSLEHLFDVEFGIEELKIVVQWLRYVNLMCITSMFMGIFTYYTFVKIIYWLTKLEKQIPATLEKKRKLVGSKIATVKIIPSSESILSEYAKSAALKGTGNDRKSTKLPLDTSDYPYDIHDDDEDNIFTLSSMSTMEKETKTGIDEQNGLSPSPTLRLRKSNLEHHKESPLTKAFRSRVSSSFCESESPTRISSLSSSGINTITTTSSTTSSVFSGSNGPHVPTTPITTIIEEEDGHTEASADESLKC